MSDHLPTMFLSHGGGPSFFLDASKFPYMKGVDKDSAAADNLRSLAKSENITNPIAILVISAHYEEDECTVTSSVKPSLLFDYGGFPPETYKLQWPVSGAPDVARRVQELLGAKGIACHLDDKRGLDHGVFVPLMLVYPGANIPVCELSLVKNMDFTQHLEIGEALSILRSEGILIIGSGFATHNEEFKDTAPHDWTITFRDWLHDVATNPTYSPEERKQKWLTCQMEPTFAKAHPTLEALFATTHGMCRSTIQTWPSHVL